LYTLYYIASRTPRTVTAWAALTFAGALRFFDRLSGHVTDTRSGHVPWTSWDYLCTLEVVTFVACVAALSLVATSQVPNAVGIRGFA
jgi:hypothetical protein